MAQKSTCLNQNNHPPPNSFVSQLPRSRPHTEWKKQANCGLNSSRRQEIFNYAQSRKFLVYLLKVNFFRCWVGGMVSFSKPFYVWKDSRTRVTACYPSCPLKSQIWHQIIPVINKQTARNQPIAKRWPYTQHGYIVCIFLLTSSVPWLKKTRGDKNNGTILPRRQFSPMDESTVECEQTARWVRSYCIMRTKWLYSPPGLVSKDGALFRIPCITKLSSLNDKKSLHLVEVCQVPRAGSKRRKQ